MKTTGKRSSRPRRSAIGQAACALLELSRSSVDQVAENERNNMEWLETETERVPSKKNKPTTERDQDGMPSGTLNSLLKSNDGMPRIPPERIVSMVGKLYTKPIRKQLTMSDVKKDQNRLMLGQMQVTKNFPHLLKKSEITRMEKAGIKVSVYGPHGDVHKMMFKIWNKKTPVLMSGWYKFVETYDLQMHRSVLTIWMFRNVVRDKEICFAIDCTN